VFELLVQMPVLEMLVPKHFQHWLVVLGRLPPQLVCYFRFDYQP